MELTILQYIQNMHTKALDAVMIFVSAITERGEVWIAAALLLLLFRKTRRCGIAVLLALSMAFIFGNGMLKNIVARERPFLADASVELLIKAPRSYSFPSGHTFSSFAAAIAILLYYRRAGILAVVLAALTAFSRMYLFVHYPTDILAGILLGAVAAVLSRKCVNAADRGLGL